MAYQRVPETVEIRVIFDVLGVEMSNVYHAKKTGGYTESEMAALANALDATPAPGFLSYMSTNDAYVRCEARGLDAENDYYYEVNTNAGAGLLSQFRPPANVSFCVRQNSGLTGRTARGRIYVPGLVNAALNLSGDMQSYVTTTYANNYVNAVDAFRTTINLQTPWQPVIVSRYLNGSKRAEAITNKWSSSDYSTLKVATRRKRLR